MATIPQARGTGALRSDQKHGGGRHRDNEIPEISELQGLKEVAGCQFARTDSGIHKGINIYAEESSVQEILCVKVYRLEGAVYIRF